MPDHNEALAGDTLYSIQLNHEWRRIVTSALQFYFQHGETGLALDNEDLFSNMIVDLYNAEAATVGILTKALSILLDVNKTTTSASFVAMTNSGFNHTPTKANMRISCSNIILAASTGNELEAEIRVAGVAGISAANAIMTGATDRIVRASALFENLTPGVEISLALYWKVSGGTGTCFRNARLAWEIVEYD